MADVTTETRPERPYPADLTSAGTGAKLGPLDHRLGGGGGGAERGPDGGERRLEVRTDGGDAGDDGDGDEGGDQAVLDRGGAGTIAKQLHNRLAHERVLQ